jgi:SNF2 family DNA or RNA helicase
MAETQTVVKKVVFEQPHIYIRELLEALNANHDNDILDVPVSCQSIDVFSLAFEKDLFYLGAMTLKPLKKGGWGGAKTCSRSSHEKVAPFVNQVYLRGIGNSRKIGSVDYYELKTEVDFLFLKELIMRGFLFWERNTHQRITFEQNPWPLAFDWVYDEASHTYSFNVGDLASHHVFIKKPYPLLFNYDTGIFYNISSSMDQRTLIHLLSLPPLKPEYTDYISKQLKGKKVPELTKPKSLIVKKIQPTPILTFKRINENYELYAGAMLSFKYETKECAYASSIKKFEHMKDGDLIHIERDTSFENTLVQNTLLEKMDFLRAVRYSYGREYYEKKDVFVPNKANTATTAKIKDTYWHKFLSTDLVQFKKNGFIIRFDDDFPYKPESEDDWYVDLEPSENNWFDTEIGVTINGEKINLLPILLKIIRSKDDEILTGYKVDVTLKLDDGREVLVRRDRINQLLTFMRSIMKIGASDDSKTKNTLKLSLLDALQLEQFKATDFSEADWSGSRVLLAFANKLHNFKGITKISPPKSLKAELRPYQQEGLNWLQFLREYGFGGILADEMGLGKTVQTLAHLLVEKEKKRLTQPVLLIVPTSLVPNWESELTNFAPSLSFKIIQGASRDFDHLDTFDILITTYPLLHRDFEHLKKQHYSHIILDEAQNIKNKNTTAVKFLMHLNSEHRLCLTGTPLENHLGELWSLFNFLTPGFLGDDRYFNREFRAKIEKRNDEAAKKTLSTRIKPFMLRRTKDKIDLDLPAKTEIIQKCELTERQRDLYEVVRLAMHKKVKDEIDKKGLNKSHIIILDALLKLRQVCCDPRLLKMEHDVTESAKLNMLMEMVEEMVEEGRKILIFSQFTGMLSLIEAELNTIKIPYVKLCGDTKDRKTPVNEFQNGTTPIFLISLKAGGVGLNLTAADVVIHYDPWWNPAVENQATDRAHRIGQNKSVFVYKFIAKDTLEEKILELQAKKASIAGALFDSENTKSAAQITQEDVNALFDCAA